MSALPFEQAGTFRPMIRLVTPVLVQQSLLLAVGLSDRLLTGKYLDTPHLAAITSMAYLLWMLQGVFSFVAIGSTAMIARFIGGGHRGAAQRVANQSILLGATVATVVVLLWAFGARVAVAGLQLGGEPAVLATEYMQILVPAIPMVMLVAVGVACWRGAGDMTVGLVIMSVVNLINLAVSWGLVLGVGPLPRLGWRGIAIGTTSGYIVGGLVSFLLLIRGRSHLRLRLWMLRPDPGLIRRLLWIGVPGGLDMLSVIGCQLWFLSLINRMGTLATAAHGVALCIESFAFIPGAAFQVAATTLAGQHLGAKDARKATRSVLAALALGGGFMSLMGVIFFSCAETLPWVLLKSSQTDVAQLASPLLRIISIAMPSVAVMMILNGGLRGAGDTRWPLAVSLTGLLGVRIPVTYWLAFPAVPLPWGAVLVGWGLGVTGAWIAMAVDLSVRATLLGVRFRHDGWKRIRV